MVTVIGQATTGYATPATTTGLPKPPDRVPAHKPWCADCKRKHDAADLDADSRCAKCARAAVSRAEAEARRAERAAEIAALERAAAAEVKAKAREQHAVVRRTPAPKPALPKPRAPKATAIPAPAPVPAPAPAATPHPALTPAPVPAADRNLDAQLQHAGRLLRATATNPHPLVATARRAAVAAIEALHLAHELNQPARTAPKTSAGPREGEAPARRTTPTKAPTKPRGKPVDDDAIVTAYLAGETAPTIARRHGIMPKRVRRILTARGVELRDDRAGHSGGRNRFEPTPDLVETLSRRYTDDHATIETLAAEHGIHRRVMQRVLVDAGVTIRPAAHLAHKPLTDDQLADIARRYAAGESMPDLADEYHVRRQTVRDAITRAGHEIRPKGNSAGNRQRLEQLGVTAAELRTWAREHGVEVTTVGLVPRAAIDAYAAAHPTASTSPSTTDITTTGAA